MKSRRAANYTIEGTLESNRFTIFDLFAFLPPLEVARPPVIEPIDQ